MTNPTTRQPAKSQPKSEGKPDNARSENVTPTPESTTPEVAKSETETARLTEDGFDVRIPKVLRVPILSEFCRQFLEIADKISEYNKKVMAEKDAEWNAPKVLERAKEFAHPTDANVKPDENVRKAVAEFERLTIELSKARKNVLDVTAGKLGISLSSVVTRDEEEEKPLKELRKRAVAIGNQLSGMAEMTTDKEASDAVNGFLGSFELPAIGRDQTRSFSNTGGNAPKYRVHVKVIKDGQEVVSEDGFTKASNSMIKHWERGKAPKATDLRKMWEDAGNTSENTKVPTVETDYDGAHFVITKR